MYRRHYRRGEKIVNIRKGGFNLEDLYRIYYSLHPAIKEPDEIARREFAFQYFGSDTYKRHLSFNTIDEVLEHMVKNPPRQAYYSVAIYELPEAKNMEEKGWLGSDLFFDIDVDHLPGCDTVLPTIQCLMEGLRIAYRIVAVARRDLGAREAHVYYTGNRGFHVVVECDPCRKLERDERREIAKYFSADDLDLTVIFPKISKKGYEPAIPGDEEPGWRGWIGGVITGKRGGLVSVLGENWKSKIEEIINDLRVEIDHQVTQDPTRLLRLEGSLNGKASLLAVPVGRDWRPDIKVLSPFNGELTVRCSNDIPPGDYIGFKGNIRKGEELSLPASVAIMLYTKGLCSIMEGEIIVRANTSRWGF